jgi:Fe-S cluster assembly iron-binding protein IscA
VQLSENAAMALKAIRENEEVPADHDTRLAADQQESGDLAVRLEFVEESQGDDEMAEQAGQEVYLDSKLIQPLADTTMDVQQTDEGLAFVFRSETT